MTFVNDVISLLMMARKLILMNVMCTIYIKIKIVLVKCNIYTFTAFKINKEIILSKFNVYRESLIKMQIVATVL